MNLDQKEKGSLERRESLRKPAGAKPLPGTLTPTIFLVGQIQYDRSIPVQFGMLGKNGRQVGRLPLIPLPLDLRRKLIGKQQTACHLSIGRGGQPDGTPRIHHVTLSFSSLFKNRRTVHSAMFSDSAMS
jgi:hypothetical protein